MRLSSTAIAYAVLLAAVTGCGGATADTPASPPTPAPENAPNAPPRSPSRAPWPMLGQGPAHQSRSLSASRGAIHRSWEVQLDEPIHGSCVIAEDGTVYAASSNKLYAISPAGTVKWTAAVRADESSPAIGADGTVYVADASTRVSSDDFATLGAALEAFTPNGSLKWQARIKGGPELQTLSSLTIAPDGTILVGTMNGPLSAVSPDGAIRWSAGADRYSSPAVGVDGTVFAMQVSTYSTHVDAFGVGGSQAYRVSGLGFTESYFDYPVVGQDGTIYIAATGLFALSATGTQRWSQPVQSERPPAVGSDGTIYVSGGKAVLAALRADDGTRHWAYTENSDWGTNYGGAVAVAADGTIYVGGNKLRLLSSAGVLLSSIDVGSPILSSLALDSDGTVIFGAEDRKVYAR